MYLGGTDAELLGHQQASARAGGSSSMQQAAAASSRQHAAAAASSSSSGSGSSRHTETMVCVAFGGRGSRNHCVCNDWRSSNCSDQLTSGTRAKTLRWRTCGVRRSPNNTLSLHLLRFYKSPKRERTQTLRLRIFGDQRWPRKRFSFRFLTVFETTHNFKASRQKT